MTGHTAGPWQITFTFNIVGADGRRGVANCGGYSENRNQEACHDENVANANLIAAAPELLEALKECLPNLGWRNYSDEELKWEHEQGNGFAEPILRARAVIRKAEGQ